MQTEWIKEREKEREEEREEREKEREEERKKEEKGKRSLTSNPVRWNDVVHNVTKQTIRTLSSIFPSLCLFLSLFL